MGNLATVCEKCHTPKNHKPGGKLYGWEPKLPSFKGATYMTSVRWILYSQVKTLFPDMDVLITYGAETKRNRLNRNLEKTHVNDAYSMGSYRPKHRGKPVYLKKKRRNNRRLEKFYDAKYIDSRDGKLKSGQQLANGRISRNHKKDSENLYPYRQEKQKKGRRSIRKQHYGIQPGDRVIFQGTPYTARGCQHYGKWVLLDNGVTYILTALIFLYFFLMLIIRRNLVYLFLELLPILLLLLIRVKVSRAIKIEKERYQVNYRNTVPLMHIEIGQDILYRIEDKEKHLSLSDIKKVLETPDMIVICLRGNLILPVKKTGFIQGDVEHCVKYLRSQIGSR